MQLTEVMSRSLVTVDPCASIGRARQLMTAHAIHHLPVLEGARLVGVVSDVDLRGEQDAVVSSVMSAPVVTLPPSAEVREAARLMRRRHIACVPVAADGELVGMVTSSDVLDLVAHTSVSPTGARLWLEWLAATVAGHLFAIAVVAFYNTFAELTVAPDGRIAPLALGVGAALEAGTIAIAQWFVLRRVFPSIALQSWLLACAVGGAVAWIAGMFVGGVAQEVGVLADVVATGAVVGGIVGAAEWLVLRRRMRSAGWWVVANAVAWIPGLFVMMVGERMDPTMGVLASVVTGAVVGAITGGALAKLVGRWQAGISPPA